MNKKILVAVILISFGKTLWASCNSFGDAIPLDYCKEPAADLLCPTTNTKCNVVYTNDEGDEREIDFSCKAGEVLDQDEANDLQICRQIMTKNRWSISSLTPEDTTIWHDNKERLNNPDVKAERSLEEFEKDFRFDNFETVDFNGMTEARSGFFRINVRRGDKNYLVYLGTKTHNFLMYRKMLRKLGYVLPMMKHHKNLVIDFENKSIRENFVNSIEDENTRGSDRWVTHVHKRKNQVTIQDVVIMEDQNRLQNLAIGRLTPDLIDGRRSMRSLLIPYSLLDVPENINMLKWNACRVVSNNVSIKYTEAPDGIDLFQLSSDDARWITERIVQLSEQDWNEVVAATNFPANEQTRLLEKLKNRRNTLAECFDVQHEKLKVDADKVLALPKVDFYEGFGRRFNYEDPEIQLLSISEMSSFFKSKLIAKGIDLAVNALNSQNFMGTDVSSKVQDINANMIERLETAVNNGDPLKTVIDKFAFPTVGGNIIVQRDIVAGSYMGTDNPIQLVDSVGAMVNVGAFGGISGVVAKTGKAFPTGDGNVDRQYSPIPLNLSANAFISRNYAHVKPIMSLKAALKYPFKNMFIPILKAKYAKVFDGISKNGFDEFSDQQKDAAFKEMMDLLNTNMEIGESIIVTTSAGIGMAAEATMNLYNVVDLKLRAAPNSMVLDRLHILRRSETEFHVFKSLGNVNGVEVALGISKYIPIMKISVKADTGVARTKFFKLDLSRRNPDQRNVIRGLQQILTRGAVRKFEKNVQKPFVIKHKFNQLLQQFGITVFKWRFMNTADKITVSDPLGDEKKLFRRYKGHTLGIDYEGFLEDLLGLVAAKIMKSDYSALSFTQTNPGFTFFGQAVNKIMTYEGEMDEKDQIHKPFAKISRIWNGWSIKKKRALRILKRIKKRYGFDYFADNVLAETEKMFLYQIYVDIYFHENGIKNMLTMDPEDVKKIFMSHQVRNSSLYQGEDKIIGSGYKRFLGLRRRYFKKISKERLKRYSNKLLKMVSVVEKKLTIEGIQKLLGGDENFYSYSYINGFRKGDGNADQDGQTLISNSLGEIGENSIMSPTEQIMSILGIGAGEFYVNWILGRII